MNPHKNFAYGTVATAPAPAASGTSLTLTAGHGARMPATPFDATVWPAGSIPDPSNAELVTVTNVAGDVCTIVRGAQSTVARTVVVGDQLAATITNKDLEEPTVDDSPEEDIFVAAGYTFLAGDELDLTTGGANGVEIDIEGEVSFS